MRTVVTAALAGTIGIIIGATGWALLGPNHTTTAKTATAAPSHTAKAAAAATSHHYGSAQAIADTLTHAGFTVSMLHKETDETYISDIGGSVYDFTVTDKAGTPAPGDAGINMFPNAKALQQWTGLSQGMGGVAVTGDTWAVSLPTGTQAARADSIRIAPKVAKTLGGTVQQ